MTEYDVISAIQRVEKKIDGVQHSIDARVKSADAQSNELSVSLVGELVAIRNSLKTLLAQVGTARAMARAPAPPSPSPGALPGKRGPLDTHDSIAAVTTDQAGSVLEGVEQLSMWKGKPALVAGFVGALLTLAVSFGLRLSAEQQTAIVTCIVLGAGIAAHFRGARTRKAIVRALTSPNQNQEGAP